MADPLEPWFFEIEPQAQLSASELDTVQRLNETGRMIVMYLAQNIALDDNFPWGSLTADYARTAIDKAREAIEAARDAGPYARPETDVEELAKRYVEALEQWVSVYREAGKRGHG